MAARLRTMEKENEEGMMFMSNALAARLAVQSFCFRSIKTHRDVIQAVRDCGLDRIELCGVHHDPITAPDSAAVVNEYNENGVSITAFGVHTFDSDSAKARKVFEFAKLADAQVINCHFGPGGIEVAEALTEEFGIPVALHNHGRWHEHGPVPAVERLLSNTSSRIGFCLDTAWMLDMLANPVDVAKKFRDRLYAVHLKDFVFDRAGRPEDVMLGTGNLDLDGILRLLVETNFDGSLTLEYEGDVDNPVPSVAKCVELVREAFDRVS